MPMGSSSSAWTPSRPRCPTSPTTSACGGRRQQLAEEGLRHRPHRPAHLNEGNGGHLPVRPPPMVEVVAHDLRERKVEPNSFHYEVRRQRLSCRIPSGATMANRFKKSGRHHRRRAGHRQARRREDGRRGGTLVLVVDRSRLVHEVARNCPARSRSSASPPTWRSSPTASGSWRPRSRVRPHRHPDQQRRRHDLDQALRALRRGRDRVRGAALALPTLWCCRAALPYMQEQGRARSSTCPRSPPAASTACPTARGKGGVNALTACLAFENAERGIRVNATAPGAPITAAPDPARNTKEQSEQEKLWYKQIYQSIDSSLMKRYGTL